MSTDLETITISDPGASAERTVRDYLSRHGAVIVRNQRTELSSFLELSERIAHKFIVHSNPAVRKRINDDPSVALAVSGTDALTVHRELGYIPCAPDVLFLYCKVPPSSEGETTAVHGPSLLNALDRDLRTRFGETIRFHHTRMPEAIWTQMFQTGEREEALRTLRDEWTGIDCVEALDGNALSFRYSVSPQVGTPNGPSFCNAILTMQEDQYGFVNKTEVQYADGSVILSEDIALLKDAVARSELAVGWSQGDWAVFDNAAWMHGRRAFSGPREIVTRFGFYRGT